jgi:hypothetical protein
VTTLRDKRVCSAAVILRGVFVPRPLREWLLTAAVLN